jgi:2-iminobutanoate/2-iminopropanoate deaminase
MGEMWKLTEPVDFCISPIFAFLPHHFSHLLIFHIPTFTKNMAHQIILTDQAPAPIGPYSQAVKAGNTVYVSGQIPLSAAGQLVGEGDVAAQTHQVLRNLTAVLAAAGLALTDVVKCSIFVKDLGNFATINQIYGTYFDEATAPARETVEVSRLPRDVEVEISCIAVG